MGGDKNVAVGIAGRVGSGKSTLARNLGHSLGWPVASFGGFVRQMAKRRNVPDERGVLQRLGTELIAEMGWVGFCRGVLESAGWKAGNCVVIDGVRHTEAIDALDGLIRPGIVTLVYVDVPEAELEHRRIQRGQDTLSLEQIERDYTESQVRQVLPSRADLRLDGRKHPDELVHQVLNWLEMDLEHC